MINKYAFLIQIANFYSIQKKINFSKDQFSELVSIKGSSGANLAIKVLCASQNNCKRQRGKLASQLVFVFQEGSHLLFSRILQNRCTQSMLCLLENGFLREVKKGMFFISL